MTVGFLKKSFSVEILKKVNVPCKRMFYIQFICRNDAGYNFLIIFLLIILGIALFYVYI